ncbi:MAG: ABC transporter ATP-binding protein [Bacteroidetes bacterium]|nr:ABC transporter ATP-binding protein [Bacteroidota bacterium]
MVSARQLKKSYGSLQVLKGIDLTIAQGEIVSVMGASGAGKSTLLHIIGTLDHPNAGEVVISGTNVFNLNSNQLAAFRNRHIGFIFQFHNLLPEFSARENIMIPGMIAGTSMVALENRVKELLGYLGLSDRGDHKPSELSGGEQQRVAVARALINKPDLVLADEPSGNLDSKNAAELHELFLQLRNELGQTFVLVTHNPALADLSDRILRLNDGLVVEGD